MSDQLDPTATFYTVKEVAAAWRLSRMTVYRMARDGVIRSVRVGRSIRLHGDSVRAHPVNEQERVGRSRQSLTVEYDCGMVLNIPVVLDEDQLGLAQPALLDTLVAMADETHDLQHPECA